MSAVRQVEHSLALRQQRLRPFLRVMHAVQLLEESECVSSVEAERLRAWAVSANAQSLSRVAAVCSPTTTTATAATGAGESLFGVLSLEQLAALLLAVMRADAPTTTTATIAATAAAAAGDDMDV